MISYGPSEGQPDVTKRKASGKREHIILVGQAQVNTWFVNY